MPAGGSALPPGRLSVAELGDAQAQVTVYNKLLAHFAGADSPDIQEWVACSLIKQASYAQLGKPKAEMACYARLVKQFADSELPYVQEQLALALLGQGHIWRQRKNLRAAVACYDQLLAHFAGPHTPFIELQCASALSEKPICWWRWVKQPPRLPARHAGASFCRSSRICDSVAARQ